MPLSVAGGMAAPLSPVASRENLPEPLSKFRACQKSNSHDLRHSHATQLLAEGIHPKIAQERLGHSSIKTTLDLYSHVSDTMQSEAASKLDLAFRSAINAKLNKGPKLG